MSLRVGASKACISPAPDLFPFGTFGGADPRSALHDDIYTRAVVIDNGETRAAIVNFDLVVLPPVEETRALIAQAGNIPEENVFMCATHNHDAPGTRRKVQFKDSPRSDTERTEKFTQIVFDGVQKAVREAAERLQPAKYGFATGESWINVNRDKQFEDGYWMQDNNYARYADKTLAVLKFVDEEENLIAAVLNYGCHAVLGFVAKDFDGKIKVSADWPGVTQGFVERRFGNDAVCLWTPAAEGNLNPVIGSGVFTYLDDGYGVRTNLPDGTAYVLMQSLGGQHAIDAIQVINGITSYTDTMDIQSVWSSVDLPAQKAPEGADMAYNRLLVDNIIPLGPNGERPEKKLVEMEDDPEHPYNMEMTLLKLGDVAFVGVPNEIYSEIGRDMKAASPMKNTVIVTHTNSNYIGYIPDKTSKGHLVFQAYGAIKPAACDEIIVEGMLKMFKELK
ncbi:MAG: neutral/alkaline non-lysosomal ceramidase N-terminal domain-containing protein [Solobacterium sp.]|nr:neutral/alkaline non-lysosomal ceramidase N-terminal domain-containing protein [Solobacterium sp.]